MVEVFQGSIIVKDISFHKNDIGVGNFKLTPSITKNVGKLTDSLYYLTLHYDILSTIESPFPFDLSISIEGQYQAKSPIDEREMFAYLDTEGVKNLFPYLRSMVTNVTSTALVNPIIMPLFGVKITKEKQ